MHTWQQKHHICEEEERPLWHTGKQPGSGHFHNVRQGQAHTCEQSCASEPNAWPLACQRWHPLSPPGCPVSTGSPTLALVPTWNCFSGKNGRASVGVVSLSSPKSSKENSYCTQLYRGEDRPGMQQEISPKVRLGIRMLKQGVSENACERICNWY